MRSRPIVVVTRRLPGDPFGALAEQAEVRTWPEDRPPSAEELRELAAPATGLITMLTDRVDRELLDACASLRVVANVAVGYDNLDLAALGARGIPAGNTPGVLTDATADLAFGLILAVARRIPEARDAVLAGEWTTWDPTAYLGVELRGATLGVVGTGRIGTALARRARGFGMRVLGWSRHPRALEGIERVPLEELLERSDVVSLHVPLDPSTHHLIDEAALARMRPGAILVNTARGAIVDQRALAAALAAGVIAGAGLDVAEHEPIPLDDPLLGLKNCVVLPHIGSATVATRTKMAELAALNVRAALAGERLPHCVNPEVYATPPGR